MELLKSLLEDFIAIDSKFIMMPMTEFDVIKGDSGLICKVYGQRGDLLFEDYIYCKKPMYKAMQSMAIQSVNSNINLAFDLLKKQKSDAILI